MRNIIYEKQDNIQTSANKYAQNKKNEWILNNFVGALQGNMEWD